MTARLPTPGGDDGDWGAILNSFLLVSHDTTGKLLSGAITTAGGITSTQVGQDNGVAGLNSSGTVPTTQLGSGTASSSNFLRGDGIWAVPAGGGGSSTLASDTDVSIASPSNNQVLTYNGSHWANEALPTADSSTLGLIQLDGDLGNSAAVPQVTATHLSAALPVNQGGTGSETQNFVDLTTNQSIGGTKTFTSEVSTAALKVTGGTLASGRILTSDGNGNATWQIPASSDQQTIVTKTSSYTLTTSDEVVLANATSASLTLTLPTAVGNTNLYSLKKIDSSANTVTVATTGGQTIDGGSTGVIKVQYASVSVVSDNSNWYII
jgi:hypothetical protein